MERIPAGAEFQFAFSLRYFVGDDVAGYLRFLAEGFELIEKHYLGGSGSRGSTGTWPLLAEDGTPRHSSGGKKADLRTASGQEP